MQLPANKKIIFSLLGLAILVVGSVAGFILVKRSQDIREQAAPATTISFSPQSLSKNPGESFDFSVNVNTAGTGAANAILVYKVVVSFNPAVIEVESVEKGSFAAPLDQNLPGVGIDNSTGRFTAGAYTTNRDNAQSGQGELLKIRGKVKEGAAPGSYNLEFTSDTEMGGRNETVNLLTDMSGGALIVLGGTVSSPSPSAGQSPSPSPSTAASPSPSAASSPSPSTAASPSPSGSTGSPSPSPSASPSTSPRASVSPSPSVAAPAGGGSAASPSPSTKASVGGTPVKKPTVTLPVNKTVKAGDTITGTAVANSTVTITIQSDPITATVKADSAGKWSYTLPKTLASGTHTMTVVDSNGSYTTTFTVSGAAKGGVSTPSGQTPVAGFGLPTFFAVGAGFLLILFGALLAF